jgi:basic amino acid/polyamine antiporter, APA family
VLGPWAGFSAGWMFLASKIAAAGTVALGLAGYLDALIPGLPPRTIATGAVVFFTALNYYGIRRSSRMNLAIVSVSLVALAVFVAAGVRTVSVSHLTPFAPYGWGAALRASAILFFAYTGYARIATLGEEVRDPRTTIPRAVIVTIAGAILLYLGVAFVAIGSAGAPALADRPAPLEIAARSFRYPGVAVVVAVGGVTAMLGVILSQLLGLSRMAFAMSRRGDLPQFLAHVHPRHGVPARAVLVIGAAAAVVAATGTLAGVAAAASFTILVYYAIANLCALRMPRSAKLYHDVVPAFGLIACAVLALSLTRATILIGAAVLAAGLGGRALLRRREAA